MVIKVIETGRAAAKRGDIPANELNNLAWFLLTAEPEDQRDPKTALAIATRAYDLERAAGAGSLWMYVDTLALAQHRSGDSKAALATQREAMRLIPPAGEKHRAEMEGHLRE